MLEQLVSHCSRKRQICLFSATFPVTVKDFKDRHISNPYEINLMDELTLKVRLVMNRVCVSFACLCYDICCSRTETSTFAFVCGTNSSTRYK